MFLFSLKLLWLQHLLVETMDITSWDVGHVLKTGWKWSTWGLIWEQGGTNLIFISHNGHEHQIHPWMEPNSDQATAGCCGSIETKIQEMRQRFLQEIDKLRRHLRSWYFKFPPKDMSTTSETAKLQSENKERAKASWHRYESLKLEAKLIHDENKSLITDLRLSNNEILNESTNRGVNETNPVSTRNIICIWNNLWLLLLN